jgi:hypothetical protein
MAISSNRLAPQGRCVVSNGQPRITRGPAVDSAAALDGYYLYEAADLNAATPLAGRIPAARWGGSVEVRPVMDR